MLSIRFIPHSVNVPNGSFWINQIDDTSPNHGVTLFEESTGSQTDREFVAAKDASPVLPISTSDLTVLSSIGFSGYALVSGSGGLIAYARELPLDALPTAVATAHHIKLAVADGLIVPMSIRASHNNVAKLSMMVHGVSVAGSVPFIYTASSAISSGAGQAANFFTTGPFKYTISGGASRLVQGIKDISVNFGLGVNKESSDGEVYPTHVSIISRMPSIEFTTSDVEMITEIGDGVSVSAAAAYFRNITANGQRVAAATTSHVSVSATAGMITPSATKLSHKKSGEASFVFTPVLNSTLAAISIAAAIPTT